MYCIWIISLDDNFAKKIVKCVLFLFETIVIKYHDVSRRIEKKQHKLGNFGRP